MKAEEIKQRIMQTVFSVTSFDEDVEGDPWIDFFARSGSDLGHFELKRIVAFVFERINAHCMWSSRVRSHHRDRHAGVPGAEVECRSDHLCRQSDVREQYIHENHEIYRTIIICDESVVSAFTNRNPPKNVDLNLVLNANTVMIEETIRNVRMKINMLVEMCPCSNPLDNTVRTQLREQDHDAGSISS
ncbi:hypothetical protein N7499_004465 [Penicillium canescens]|uniref:Uncharacterized protein n=1 Tax=Penicillium canescens TaxID=5083 RepID=A0AAD6I9B3_PENCN|nr:hypothetical protein N7460_008153 [Penicillium canescens]KAJ6039501.1 hypothetical protein N7444_008406 [Penicillium canescens]KAJ6084836.1 hypothetical protein N7499_004465 [Penicillium canescens]KAJ6161621.1 hypothetical protein N7485_009851 [Penicillium canescens]